MTAEELEQLIKQGDPRKLISAMTPLDEPQRKKLAKTASGLWRRARKQWADGWQAQGTRYTMSPGSQYIEHLQRFETLAALAVMGLCSWTDVKRVPMPRFVPEVPNATDLTRQVLRARRPEWIDQWVQLQLDSDACDWSTIRQFIRDGVCQRPTSDVYITQMIRHHAHGWGADETPLADVLRADSGLLDHEVWRIFEFDLGRQALFSGEQYAPPTWKWQTALVDLAGAGEIDRQRLLTASLQAMGHQSQAANAAWFCRLHDALAPTLDDRVGRQSQYMDLLSSTVSAVVGFALDALKAVAQTGKLDAERFAAAVGPVFDLRQKTHPAAAVKVLRLAAKQTPAIAHRVAAVAARGLAHAAPDVQKGCVDLIESLANLPDAALAEAIAAGLDSVAASQRSRIDAVMAKMTGGSPAAARSAEDSTACELPTEAEISAIPAPWRALAGVDACQKVLREGGELPRLEFDPMSVPRLDPAARLTPIHDLDELIERASAAVEDMKDADELELLLDAMSRFADQRPDGFSSRTAPLRKRVGNLLSGASWSSHWLDASTDFRFLVWAWLERKLLGRLSGTTNWLSLVYFLSARIANLSLRLAGGESRPASGLSHASRRMDRPARTRQSITRVAGARRTLEQAVGSCQRTHHSRCVRFHSGPASAGA